MFFELFNIPTSLFIHKENDIEFISSGYSTLIGNDKSNKFDYKVTAFKCPVIYSTNSNLEHFYIHSIFDASPVTKNFDVVIINEIDNMFIDESASSFHFSMFFELFNIPTSLFD